MSIDPKNLMTVKQLVATYPAFTEPMIRWWIFNADQNGMNMCLLRVRGRILIDNEAFGDWLETHRVGKPETAEAL